MKFSLRPRVLDWLIDKQLTTSFSWLYLFEMKKNTLTENGLCYFTKEYWCDILDICNFC